jgi:amidase
MATDGAANDEDRLKNGAADIVFAPAHVLAQAIQHQEVSSVELVEAYLARIAHHNPQLNAVATLDEDGVRHRAQEEA